MPHRDSKVPVLRTQRLLFTELPTETVGKVSTGLKESPTSKRNGTKKSLFWRVAPTDVHSKPHQSYFQTVSVGSWVNKGIGPEPSLLLANLKLCGVEDP